jgi:hypothetical protein
MKKSNFISFTYATKCCKKRLRLAKKGLKMTGQFVEIVILVNSKTYFLSCVQLGKSALCRRINFTGRGKRAT